MLPFKFTEIKICQLCICERVCESESEVVVMVVTSCTTTSQSIPTSIREEESEVSPRRIAFFPFCGLPNTSLAF